MVTPVTYASDYPSPTSAFYVNDFANILSDDTEREILSEGVKLASETKAQVVVVTVNSLEGDSVENYAWQLFQEWGIGDSEQNNGVLLLVAMEDRKTRIEVGYGLEGALNDGKTGRIQDDYLIQNLSNGDYDSGVLGTYLKLVEEVYAEYGIDASTVSEQNIYYNPVDTTSNSLELTIGKVILGFIIVVIVLLDIIFNRGRLLQFLLIMSLRGGRGGRGGGFGGGGFGGGGGRSGGGGSSRGF